MPAHTHTHTRTHTHTHTQTERSRKRKKRVEPLTNARKTGTDKEQGIKLSLGVDGHEEEEEGLVDYVGIV